MRTIVGVTAVFGLAAAVAGAQPPRERAANFRPPEALQPGDLPSVARGAADDFPPSSFLPSTPVARTSAPGVAGPAWLSGADAKVVPASATTSKADVVRPLTPPATVAKQKDPSAPAIRGFDWLKFSKPAATTGPQPAPSPPASARPQPAEQVAAQPKPPAPSNANTPFSGTSANGTAVYAGPPAYRWYGWGTVTPGANPFAPTGRFPNASAGWYSITGATPGAFPVPVMNPLRTPPSTEPPSYGTARMSSPHGVVPAASEVQPIVQPPQPRSQPAPTVIERPEPPKFNPPVDTKPVPGAGVGLAPTPPVNVPKLTPPPVATPVVSAPPVTAPVVSTPPVVPVPAPIPTPVAAKEPAPLPLPALPVSVPTPEPVASLPPSVLPPLPVAPSVAPAKPVELVAPSPLPISMTDEPKPVELKRVEVTTEVKHEAPRRENWQPTTEPAQPRPGTWAPANDGREPLPTMPADAWKSGAAPTKPIVARGQMPDNSDPIADLIQQVCRGRAEGVEVRPAGPKKLMVCFETRTAADAQKLVTDISRRPELGPYQIDFCVVVK